MENQNNPVNKETSFPSGTAMPSRRASRHVERVHIQKEDVKEVLPEVQEAVPEIQEAVPEIQEAVPEIQEVVPELLEEEPGDLPTIEFEDLSAEKKAPEGKKANGKRIRAIIFAVIAALIVAGVAVGIILCLQREKQGDSRNYMDQLRNQEIAVTEEESINAFFRTYYDAMSAGDTTALESMFDDPSKANVSAAISTIVESYENLQVYSTEGLEENEVAVFVSNEVKFHNINTTAPSVDCYYLTRDPADGTYKICADMYEDTNIIRFLRLASYLQPIRTLMEDSDARLESALNADKDLKNLYIVMQSMTDAVLDESAEENEE
ncbi:MAG: hypothetical protein J5483_00620 [Lachnospiraceae bacterium]|nr:hypothetical protein [Lachnospiraceae bacterium]